MRASLFSVNILFHVKSLAGEQNQTAVGRTPIAVGQAPLAVGLNQMTVELTPTAA
jgi:hypothetical protein